LIDANIPMQKIDLDFMNWLGERGVPFVIAFTKCDRSSRTQLDKNLVGIRAALGEHWETLPPQFITSAADKNGKEEILGLIEVTNRLYFGSHKPIL
jgi:GTP-binding protein